MVPCVENEASPSTKSALRTPPARACADIAYSLSPKTAVAVISPTGMRANEIVGFLHRVHCRRLSPLSTRMRSPRRELLFGRCANETSSWIRPLVLQPTMLDLGSVRAGKRHYWRPLLPRIGCILTQRLRLGDVVRNHQCAHNFSMTVIRVTGSQLHAYNQARGVARIYCPPGPIFSLEPERLIDRVSAGGRSPSRHMSRAVATGDDRSADCLNAWLVTRFGARPPEPAPGKRNAHGAERSLGRGCLIFCSSSATTRDVFCPK